MRKHLLRSMNLSSDKALPDSHDGSMLPPSSPVRFVWTQTVLQSSHNLAMRKHVVDDLIRHRLRYKRVPDSEFADRKALESVFDQAYTSLRAKWRAQRNPGFAQHERLREEIKSVKARRAVRKKAVCIDIFMFCMHGANLRYSSETNDSQGHSG
jgi:hypothetical protein